MAESIWLRELTQDLDWRSPGEITRVRAFAEAGLALEAGATHYVFLHDGTVAITRGDATFPLASGMFAALPGACTVGATGARGLVISHLGYQGMFQLGGPIEAEGRLRYIDGCTDTLLLSPMVLGDPCLNHLHIPPHTNQTKHLHPSVRVGMIVRGEGHCMTEHEEFPLRAGLAFMIAKDVLHSFRTNSSSLDVVVYHPDSDTGPTHEDHPMLNRTWIR